jgi:hypothetical protein
MLRADVKLVCGVMLESLKTGAKGVLTILAQLGLLSKGEMGASRPSPTPL